jgi:three-Cys-motif partner protein
MSDQPLLFDESEIPIIKNPFAGPTFKSLKHPVWTEQKARLIERYLFYFVLITKHGTYVDGFAGPQTDRAPHSWAAKLVLESTPKRLRNFYLCEIDGNSYSELEELKKSNNESGRKIEIFHGDFNKKIHEILKPENIKPKEATFCLLDQRTLECDWATVEAIAKFPKSEFKIELFYFFATGWLDRVLSSRKDKNSISKWWGGDGWSKLPQKHYERARHLCERFKLELGYKFAYPWPIYGTEAGNRVMYYMIHASDHPKAPGLMHGAYHRARYDENELQQQLEIMLEKWSAS